MEITELRDLVEESIPSLSEQRQRKPFLAGIACICFVAVVWTLATVLKQVIFQELDYDEPLILTVVCNACYAVHFPLHVLLRACGLVERVPWRSNTRVGNHKGPEVRSAIVAGVFIAPIWFASQWTYSQGVASTSVTSSTVISTTSVVWTLLASVIFLKEKLSFLKIIGIIACMAGNVATLWGNDVQKGQEGELFGDILCLISAVLYASYTTVLTILTGHSTSMSFLFGTIGLVVIIVGMPLMFIFSRSGLDRMTSQIFGLLIFNGLFDNVLSQFAWAKAVQWTSPTAATVGLSLTIPLSVIADLVRKKTLTGWSYLAAFLVILGFVSVTIASRPQKEATVETAEAEEAIAEKPPAIVEGQFEELSDSSQEVSSSHDQSRC